MTAPLPSPPAQGRRDLLLLALAFGALFFFRLGSYPLTNPDEGRNAEIAREMLATGDFITPRLNGVNYFEKPPLVYWVTAATEKFFGLNEWSVRAVPALFALLGVLLTYGAGRALHGRNAGLLAAIVLGTSLLWFALAHIPILDMAVSVLMATALFGFILGVGEASGPRRRGFFFGLYASMALATLAKGLIGFLVTGAVMFLWLLVFNQWKRLRPLHLPSGAVIFLAIAAPWHVLAARHNETWAHRYFVYEHWLRFTTDAASRVQPWHFFIWVVIAGLIPWTGFLWPAVREAVGGGSSGGLRAGWAQRRENSTGWFFVTWVVVVFFFFSISKSKLPPYILPIFPALAVLIGAWLARVLAAGARLRVGFGIHSFLAGLLAVVLVTAVLRPALVNLDGLTAQALRVPGFVMAGALALGGVFVPWLAKTRGARAALTALVATTVLFLAGLQFAAPHIAKPGTKSLAEIVAARAGPADRVLHYHEFFHDFTFYAQRLVDVVAFKGELELEEDAAARASGRFMDEAAFRALWAGPVRVWGVVRKRDQSRLFGDAAFRYHLIAESPGHTLFSNQP